MDPVAAGSLADSGVLNYQRILGFDDLRWRVHDVGHVDPRGGIPWAARGCARPAAVGFVEHERSTVSALSGEQRETRRTHPPGDHTLDSSFCKSTHHGVHDPLGCLMVPRDERSAQPGIADAAGAREDRDRLMKPTIWCCRWSEDRLHDIVELMPR